MKALSLDNCRLDGRYDIREQLGRGSYAEIFIARDILASPQSPHNQVVIKALNVFLQDDLDADLERTLVENFQNEALALDRVRHPNIISRLGHGTARDLRGTVFHYLVLEYLAGGDLQKASRGGQLSFLQALKYLEQVCAGLDHAHQNGIIHRDIKPQNLLLTRDRDTVKIADFGVARITSTADSPITRVGTNVFAPPEHTPSMADPDIEGPQNEVYTGLTPAADIYSLAKSAYVLVTGESPRAFAGRPISSLPEAVRGESWAPAFTATLTRATQSDPGKRHQNVSEFWRDVARLQQFANENDNHAPLVERFPAVPQPHVARGYTPIAPTMPTFNTSRDYRLRKLESAGAVPLVVKVGPRFGEMPPGNGNLVQAGQMPVTSDNGSEAGAEKSRKRRRPLRRFAVFVVCLVIFTGILYGTHAVLRGRGLVPEIRNPFRTQTGVANTDINLRPDPSTNGDPIGLVTKNSKLKIVNSRDNWYQVDIIEQGRQNGGAPAVTRGWINGKYIDLD
jgi:serine/threonine protein kinase